MNKTRVSSGTATATETTIGTDYIRAHRIGGGDQIYNDGIRVSGPLRPWTDISNPKKRREYPFSDKLRQDCDEYYLKNYIRW
jgi:hypothetical protein